MIIIDNVSSAHAALLVLLAEQHRDEDLEYLLKVAKDDSKIGQHALIRGGALKGRQYNIWYDGVQIISSLFFVIQLLVIIAVKKLSNISFHELATILNRCEHVSKLLMDWLIRQVGKAIDCKNKQRKHFVSITFGIIDFGGILEANQETL